MSQIVVAPRHPYSNGLMASTPAASVGQARLRQIPGAMPRLNGMSDGCAFSLRCPYVAEKCRHDPRPRVGGAEARRLPVPHRR